MTSPSASKARVIQVPRINEPLVEPPSSRTHPCAPRRMRAACSDRKPGIGDLNEKPLTFPSDETTLRNALASSGPPRLPWTSARSARPRQRSMALQGKKSAVERNLSLLAGLRLLFPRRRLFDECGHSVLTIPSASCVASGRDRARGRPPRSCWFGPLTAASSTVNACQRYTMAMPWRRLSRVDGRRGDIFASARTVLNRAIDRPRRDKNRLQGRSRQLGRRIALKVLHPQNADQPLAWYVRSRLTAAQLRHPNVVSVFDVGHESGQAFLAMDLLEGHARSGYDTVHWT